MWHGPVNICRKNLQKHLLPFYNEPQKIRVQFKKVLIPLYKCKLNFSKKKKKMLT